LVICHKQLGDLTLLEPAMAKLVEVDALAARAMALQASHSKKP
jgi:hypothetical protein